MEQIVDILSGGLQGFSPGQVSTPCTSAKRLSERTAEHSVDIPGGGLHAVQGFLPGSSSTADIPPGGGMGDSRGQATCRFSPSSEFISVCGAECG